MSNNLYKAFQKQYTLYYGYLHFITVKRFNSGAKNVGVEVVVSRGGGGYRYSTAQYQRPCRSPSSALLIHSTECKKKNSGYSRLPLWFHTPDRGSRSGWENKNLGLFTDA